MSQRVQLIIKMLLISLFATNFAFAKDTDAKSKEQLLSYKLIVVPQSKDAHIGSCESACNRIYFPDEQNPKYILEYTEFDTSLRDKLWASKPVLAKVAQLTEKPESLDIDKFSSKRAEFLRAYLAYLDRTGFGKKKVDQNKMRRAIKGLAAIDEILISNAAATQSADRFSLLLLGAAGTNLGIDLKNTTPDSWGILINTLSLFFNQGLRWDAVHTRTMWDALIGRFPTLKDKIENIKFGFGPTLHTGFQISIVNDVLDFSTIIVGLNNSGTYPGLGISWGAGLGAYVGIAVGDLSSGSFNGLNVPGAPMQIYYTQGGSKAVLLGFGAGVPNVGNSGQGFVIMIPFNTTNFITDPMGETARFGGDVIAKSFSKLLSALGYRPTTKIDICNDNFD